MNSSSFKLSSIEVQMFKKRIYFLLSVLGLSLQLRAWPLGEAVPASYSFVHSRTKSSIFSLSGAASRTALQSSFRDYGRPVFP